MTVFLSRTARISILAPALLLTVAFASATAQTPEGNKNAARPLTMDQRLGKFGDQGDGTYINPILPGDFQNTDVLRVGARFYYISATKAMSPGMAVMQSDDLVNWKIVGHVIPDITVFSPRFNYDRMEGAQRGVWAGTLAHHAGLFYAYFTTPDEGIFVSTAKDPAGPWSPLTCLMAAAGWDDPAPLFDDDGKAYLTTTNFALDPKTGKTYNIHLFEMTPDGLALKLESDKIIHQSRGSEANKLYKIGPLYYHFFSEVTPEGRVPMIGRATAIAGPYELRQLNHVSSKADREPNQGSILQTQPEKNGQPGNWVFLTHHGVNEWEGRPASLLPVTWVDGWPMVGQVSADGIGNMVWSAHKPIASRSPKATQTAGIVDEFASPTLAPEWEWYFQPNPAAWSLTERPGFLRLHATRPLAAGDLLKTPNILTQRPLRVNHNTAVVKIDVSHMADGQRAGLCTLGRTYAAVGVVDGTAGRTFYRTDNARVTAGPPLAADAKAVWLRATWDTTGLTQFAYSVNGVDFTALGDASQMTSFGGFLGAKIGIFTSNEQADAGYIDVDSFRYTFSQ